MPIRLHLVGASARISSTHTDVSLTDEKLAGVQAYHHVLDAAQRLLGQSREAQLYSPDGRLVDADNALWVPIPGSTRRQDLYALRPGQMWVWPARNATITIDHGDGELHLHHMEVLSTSPRVLRIRQLFTAAECDIIRTAAEERYTSSGSFDTSSGEHYALADGRRVSDTAWVGLHWGLAREGVHSNGALERLQRRAADAARVHLGHAEPWQVVRYRAGGYQRHHLDSFLDETLGTARHATVLTYLNDGFVGGATQFPYAPEEKSGFVFNAESCSQGLTVHAARGDALVFYNAIERPDGAPSGTVAYDLDERARHAACPLHEGTKYIANVWLHPAPIDEAMHRCAALEGTRHAACMRREARAR